MPRPSNNTDPFLYTRSVPFSSVLSTASLKLPSSRSTPISKSLTTSFPLPGLNLSLPRPPVRVSSPFLPMRLSFSPDPVRKSSRWVPMIGLIPSQSVLMSLKMTFRTVLEYSVTGSTPQAHRQARGLDLRRTH